MAANLEILLERRVATDTSTGTALYQVRAAVLRRVGDIDPAIFVMLLDQSGSEDAFERVASLTDLSTFVAARDAAMARGDDYYRVSNADIDFDTAELAADGSIAVEDAINTLVRSFNDFIGLGSPSTTVQKVVTGVDKTFLEQLKTDYATTQSAVTELEADESSLQTGIDTLKESLDTQAARIQTLQDAREALFTLVSGKYNGHVAQYTAILLFPTLSAPEIVQVGTYKTAAQTDVSTLGQVFAGVDGIIADERSLLTTTYQDIEGKTQEQAQVSAQLAEKRSALDRVLAQIIELEPTFAGV